MRAIMGASSSSRGPRARGRALYLTLYCGDDLHVAALIEREQDVATLHGLLRRVADGGAGGAILIEGEAGCGKTSLLAGARAAGTAGGLRVLAALADEEESEMPLAAARVLLARPAAELLGRGDAWLGAGLARRGALALTGA